MRSVYGKRPEFKGEKGFPKTQTNQDYHTLDEILNKYVQDGRPLPVAEQPEIEDSLDDIDPTRQRGFDIADFSEAQRSAREAVLNDPGVKWSKPGEKTQDEPVLPQEPDKDESTTGDSPVVQQAAE